MLRKFSSSGKLYLLVFTLSIVMIGIGAFGISALKTMNQNTQTLYADRVFPLQQLTTVRYSYATDILSATLQVKDHQLTYDEARKRIEQARVTINANWSAYMGTYLTPEEAQLAKQNAALMVEANKTIQKLVGILNNKEPHELDKIIKSELYTTINPVISKLNELVQLQVKVSGELYKRNGEVYNSTAKKFYFLIAVSLLLAFILSYFILSDTWSLIRNLEASNRKITESEAKCRAFIKYAGDSILILDPSLRITDVNDSAVKLTGYPREELLQLKISDIISQDELPSVSKTLDIIVKEGGSVHERKFKRKDGSIVETEVNVRMVEGVGFISIVRDISQQIKAEKELRERAAQLTTLFENMEGATSMLDTEKRYVLFNNRFILDNHLLTNSSPSIGDEVYTGFPEAIRNERLKMLDNVLKGNREVVEVDYLRDGKRVYYRTAFSPVITDEKVTGISTYSLNVTKSKEAEEKIRQSEEWHRALTENISDAIMLLDANLDNIYQSPSVERITGYRTDDGSSKKALDFIHPEDLQIAQEFFQIAMSSPGEAVRSQFRIRHKDLHYIWVEGTVMNLLQNENVKAFIVNYRDITERKRAETLIKEQAETFSAIIENANESIWMLSPDLKVLQYNKTAKERLYLNRGKEIYIGADFKEFLHVGTENVFIPMFNDALAGKYPELESCQKDTEGKEFWLRTRMYPVYDAQKKMIGITVLTENITNRKKAEKELEQSEEKHRSLIENIGDAIYLINEKAEIIYRSPSADRVSSYTAGEMAGKKIFDFVHPDDLNLEKEIFNRSNELPGVSVPFELRSRHKEGHYIWLEGSIINLQQTPGINGFVLTYRDITERKKDQAIITELNESLEQKVIERTSELQEANKALEAFSYSVSHDLRAPVRTVMGFAKIIKTEYGTTFNKEVNELFDHIEGSSKRMNTIIDDLLTLAKYEKVKLQPVPVDMEKLMKKVWTEILFHTPHSATLQIGALPEALADTSLIEQVVVNLLSNAVKYSSKKEKPVVSVGFEMKDSTVTFSVKDNGAGFDMKNYDRLFGAFQRLHGMSEFEGTGVGLLLVKRIVEKHGGVVWAESKLDEGATFYFTLPSISAG